MRTGPATSLAAAPVATKMPAPMMAPTPRAVSVTGPRTRLRRLSPSASASRARRDLRANSWLLIAERSVRFGDIRAVAGGWGDSTDKPASGRVEDERDGAVVDQL